MSVTIGINAVLVEIECGGCGWVYAIPRLMHQEAQERGLRWRCPNRQCSWESVGFSETELQRLRKETERAKNAQKWAEECTARARKEARSAIASAVATRGHMTRIKKRVGNGVCPCCKRTFRDLARHMTGKHPTWNKETT